MMNNPQENQQAQHYQNHWWEVELVRKEQRIAELEQRIAELKLRLVCCRDASTGKDLLIAKLEAGLDVRDRKLSDISSACESAGCLYDEAMDEFIFKQKQRIAELEAQVPRDVVPETGSCECGGYVLDVLGDRFAYCPDCGAKLDWRTS